MIVSSKFYYKLSVLICFLLCFNTSLFSQDKIALGVSGMYNFPLNSVGIGLRAQIPVIPRVQLVPQFKYAPPFNTIHELFAGLNINYIVFKGNVRRNGFKKGMEVEKPTIYLTGGVEYNRWINYIETQQKNSKQNNFLPEVGIGTSVGNYSVRFFGEIKYNIRWQESYGEIGLLICPAYIKSKRKASCPIY